MYICIVCEKDYNKKKNNFFIKFDMCKNCAIKHIVSVKEKYAKYRINYYQKNKEKINKNIREEYWKDPKKHYLRTKASKAKNPEKYKEYSYLYHKGYDTHIGRKSKPNKFVIPYSINNTFTMKDVKLLIEKQQSKCFYCDKLDNRLTANHFIPLRKKGNNRISNIRMTCWNCVHKKRDKLPELFLEEINRLDLLEVNYF